MLLYTIHKTKFAVHLLPCGSTTAVGHCSTAKYTFIQKIWNKRAETISENLNDLIWQCCWSEDFRCADGADVSTGHITENMNTTSYYFTSCSLSVFLFRSRFRAKLSPQWQLKCFCVQSNVSLQTNLPTECLPTDQHTKPFSPHCITRCHIKYPLSAKGFWSIVHIYMVSHQCES
jgi:hypothetical protein